MPKRDKGLSIATTRRRFLGLSGAALFLYGGRQGLDIGGEMLRQEQAWADAAPSNDDFLRAHRDLFQDVTIGASFAPEQWSAAQGGDEEALRGFRWMAERLGLNEVRLGFRWQRVEAVRGRVDLSQYAPFLDYALRSGLRICLNLGPIRTFRWPEDHLPAWLASGPELPPRGATIGDSSDLAARASDYLERLLDTLVRNYGRQTLAALPTVQVENEPFYPQRGHKWVLAQDYVRARTRQVQGVFPSSKLLVATAGRLNFGEVRELITAMMAESDAYRGRFVMGFDYHYKTPFRDSFPLIRLTDPITFARVGYETCEDNRLAAKDIGYDIEVTEGQAEPNGYLSQPGNSARHFRFMLLRCAGRVLDTSRPSLIRVWGIEEMAKKALAGTATDEHQAIFDIMRRINDTPAVRPPVQAPAARSPANPGVA